jgi:hypothetical protein
VPSAANWPASAGTFYICFKFKTGHGWCRSFTELYRPNQVDMLPPSANSGLYIYYSQKKKVCIFIQWPLPLHLEIQVDLHTHKVHPSIICASHFRLLRVHAASVTSPHVRERDHVGWRLCSQFACAYRLHQSCDAHKPGPAGSHFWNRFFFFALNFIEINWRTKKGSLWA